MRWFYSLLLCLSLPVVFLRLYIKGAKSPAYRQRWAERLGIVDQAKKSTDQSIWIHAVSVGEVEASLPLIKVLFEQQADRQIVITTTTPTGAETVRRRLLNAEANPHAKQIRHFYIAYDLASFQRRFIGSIKAYLLIIMETEIWPNLIAVCDQQQIPVLLANARMSASSQRGYARLGSFTRETFAAINQVAAQTELDAQRLITLGVKADQLSITGSLKFDLTVSEATRIQGAELRDSLGQNRPVWIAASTHPGEEQQIIEAHKNVLQNNADTLLILVPRHPERFDQVFDLCLENELTTSRRSKDKNIEGQVYLFDTMGELMIAYAASDIAFVAGSLEPIGGHNLLEAASLDLPVIMGPHTFKIERIFQTFLDAQAVIRVNDAMELGAQLVDLFEHPKRGDQLVEHAAALLKQSQGSAQRHLALIDDLL